MDEIRFNRPELPKETEPPINEMSKMTEAPKAKQKSHRIIKKILKLLIAIIIIGLVGVGVNKAKSMMKSEDPNASEYYATFLANGQVYFGELKEKNRKEFVLTNVYYLQLTGDAEAQQELSESRFSLVKLGDELHGPTDEMFINMDNLLFYERLKKDSKVVQSIIGNK